MRIIDVFGIIASELVDPNWTVTLNQPATEEGETGETVMQGNALRMFETLYESQQSQLKHLENKVERLQKQLGRLEGQTRLSAVRF